jgi:hypothetical protein
MAGAPGLPGALVKACARVYDRALRWPDAPPQEGLALYHATSLLARRCAPAPQRLRLQGRVVVGYSYSYPNHRLHVLLGAAPLGLAGRGCRRRLGRCAMQHRRRCAGAPPCAGALLAGPAGCCAARS